MQRTDCDLENVGRQADQVKARYPAARRIATGQRSRGIAGSRIDAPRKRDHKNRFLFGRGNIDFPTMGANDLPFDVEAKSDAAKPDDNDRWTYCDTGDQKSRQASRGESASHDS